MSMLSNKLRGWSHGDRKGLVYWCQGCECTHGIVVEGPGAWGWNGDVDRPIFTPSVLTTWKADPDAGPGFEEYRTERRCHTFVGCSGAQPGEVIFLSDCTHALAGTVQPLPDLPAHLRDDLDGGQE